MGVFVCVCVCTCVHVQMGRDGTTVQSEQKWSLKVWLLIDLQRQRKEGGLDGGKWLLWEQG